MLSTARVGRRRAQEDPLTAREAQRIAKRAVKTLGGGVGTVDVGGGSRGPHRRLLQFRHDVGADHGCALAVGPLHHLLGAEAHVRSGLPTPALLRPTVRIEGGRRDEPHGGCGGLPAAPRLQARSEALGGPPTAAPSEASSIRPGGRAVVGPVRTSTATRSSRLCWGGAGAARGVGRGAPEVRGHRFPERVCRRELGGDEERPVPPGRHDGPVPLGVLDGGAAGGDLGAGGGRAGGRHEPTGASWRR